MRGSALRAGHAGAADDNMCKYDASIEPPYDGELPAASPLHKPSMRHGTMGHNAALLLVAPLKCISILIDARVTVPVALISR